MCDLELASETRIHAAPEAVKYFKAGVALTYLGGKWFRINLRCHACDVHVPVSFKHSLYR
jgi:hypothetical protein